MSEGVRAAAESARRRLSAVMPRTESPILGSPASLVRQTRRDARRTVLYLMLFRVGLATFLLGAMVVVALLQERPESLSWPFARFVFALLAATYLATLVYALALRRVKDPVRFAAVQMGVDLTLITWLVHATGGAQSAFTFLYTVDVVAVALLPRKNGAASVAAASILLIVAVSLAGYFRWLPPVPGQAVLPWDLNQSELLYRLFLNLAGIASVGALGMSLSGQSQRAGERLVRHQQIAGDLASLHENTIRCLSSGLVTSNTEGVITSINGAAAEILGIPASSCLGHPLRDYIPGLDDVLAEAGPVGSIRRHEVDAVRPDGKRRRLGVSATPLSDYAGSIIGRVIHFQDLTELRRMQIAVERSERLAGIGRLAANIAHEIRNPLASISGSVEVLRSLPAVDGDARQLFDIAVREVDRLNRLITQFLDYARPGGEDRQRIDMGEAATEIARAFDQEKRTHDVHIEVEADPDVCIEGGAGQIHQVLWNLLRNAAEAMPSGGTVRVRVTHEESRGGDRLALLSVSDTGHGMSKEDLERIFEPFFSTKVGGTGLGLATVARIVEEHRGHIETNSAPGQGTTFSLRFLALAAALDCPRSSLPLKNEG